MVSGVLLLLTIVAVCHPMCPIATHLGRSVLSQVPLPLIVVVAPNLKYITVDLFGHCMSTQLSTSTH